MKMARNDPISAGKAGSLERRRSSTELNSCCDMKRSLKAFWKMTQVEEDEGSHSLGDRSRGDELLWSGFAQDES